MKRLLVIAIVALFGFAFGCGGASLPETPEVPDAETPDVEAIGEDEAGADEVEGEIDPEEAADEETEE